MSRVNTSKKYKVILFDFDGTIADTMLTIYDIIQDLSAEFGYKRLSDKEADGLRDLSIQEILKKVRFPLWKFPFLVKRTKEELQKKIPFIKVVPGMKSVLQQLKKQGFKMGVVSSNTKESVEQFFKNNNLSFFDFVYTGSSLFGKERKIKRSLEQYKLLPNETVYIGDEVRDIEAAKKLHLAVISVTWGFNTKEALQKYNPDFIIASPKELLRIL